MESTVKKSFGVMSVITYWVIETSAFILLPLFVYIAVYYFLGLPLSKVLRVPEWMIISTFVYSQTAREQIMFYKAYKGFELKAVQTISVSILGIVASVICLVFTMIAEHKADFVLPEPFYIFQTVVFVISLLMLAVAQIWKALLRGDAHILPYIIPETELTPQNKEVVTGDRYRG